MWEIVFGGVNKTGIGLDQTRSDWTGSRIGSQIRPRISDHGLDHRKKKLIYLWNVNYLVYNKSIEETSNNVYDMDYKNHPHALQ